MEVGGKGCIDEIGMAGCKREVINGEETEASVGVGVVIVVGVRFGEEDRGKTEGKGAGL